jgi:hypothetical protein
MRNAQAILVDHIRPNGPTGEETVNALLTVLDNHQLVRALDTVHPRDTDKPRQILKNRNGPN